MYIAHINRSGKVQTLDEHLQCVADMCSRNASKVGLSGTARLAALLHDMGKTASQFSQYLIYCHDHPEDKSLRGKTIHSTQGAKYIYENYGLDQQLGNLVAAIIATIIAGHHGGLMDCVSPEGDQPFYRRLSNDDPKLNYAEVLLHFPEVTAHFKEFSILFENAKKEIAAFSLLGKEKNLNTPFNLHLLVRLLFSFLIDADRFDAFRFETGLPIGAEEEKLAPWAELSTNLEKYLNGFDSNKPINRLRSEISQQCKLAAQRPSDIYQLSVPTGGGKTLSSLRYALEHARVHNKERIFYIIPYTTIIDQNAKEIRDILKRDDLILEHHSNVVREKQTGKIESDESETEYKLLAERWNSPIILTTMVQFLNSLFEGGTASPRRMHRFINAVLIFDEIQAIPANCMHLLTNALNFLSHFCGSTILLCTATQPELSELERPLKLNPNSQIIGNMDEVFRSFKRTCVIDSRKDGGYGMSELRQFMLEKLAGLRTCLAIFNTKNQAEQLYKEIDQWNNEQPPAEQFNVFHLSTGLCPAHRKDLLNQIRLLLPDKKVICISTQLIEAGVDISFQCVIRALAGLDSIAQAAGRCNRHKEYEGCRQVYIVNIKGENLEHLPDIQMASQAAGDVLDKLRQTNEDPASQAALKEYYLAYYQRIRPKMDYPVPRVSPHASLVDLLGKNTIGCQQLLQQNLQKPPLQQAFATGGENFQVIENGTESVIVPYKRGVDILAKMRCDLLLSERFALLRQVQQYAVNIFPWEKKILEREHALEVLPGGELALAANYYHEKLGLTKQGSIMDPLLV